MLYDLTLRDLSIAATGAQVGVCLRLHGYREVRVGTSAPKPDSLFAHMVAAKAVGYHFIAAGTIPTINAVEPPDPDDLLATAVADADRAELRTDDVMYLVANDYDTHQWMREAIRKALVRGSRLTRKAARKNSPSISDDELEGFHQGMCMLSLWLSLHDPEFANSIRQRMFECLKEYRRAVLTVACTKNLAYARNISTGITDLTEALGFADNSDRSGLYSRH